MENEHRYSFFRLFHFFSGLLWGLAFVAGPRKKNRIIFNSTHNRFYNFNSKYLFEYFLKKKGWECRFVIDDELMRTELVKEIGPYFISPRGIANKLYILKAATWVTSSLETPVGGVGLGFRRLVINLGHGTPVKATGLADKKASWLKRLYYTLIRTNFSYFLASSEKAAEFVQKAFGCSKEKIATLCQPRLAPLLKTNIEAGDNEYSILYAPTWRKSGEPQIFPFADYDKQSLENFLRDKGIKISLRLHPFFENSIYLDHFLTDRVTLLSTKEAPEIMDVLGEFNALITDYSSIFVDYLILNRPIMFFPYDLEDYQKNTSFMAPYNDLTPGPHVFSQEDFITALKALLAGADEFSKKRVRLNDLLNGKLKEPSRDSYDFIARRVRYRN